MHLNTYGIFLRRLEIFVLLQHGERLFSAESDVYRRQILTTKVGPRAVRVNYRHLLRSFNPYNAKIFLYRPRTRKGFFEFEISSLRFIWIPVLWVYGHYEYFIITVRELTLNGIIWRLDVYGRHILTSEVGRRS